MKKVIISIVIVFLLSQSCFAQGKLILGLISCVVGLSMANDGFGEIERKETIYFYDTVKYTWTEQTLDQEWDYWYKTEIWNTSSGTLDASFNYTDPSPSSIAYKWTYSDYLYVGSDLMRTDIYKNHHITYKTITYSGTTTVNASKTITHKEQKNIEQGILGVALVSFGITQILDCIIGDTLHAKTRPKIKCVSKPSGIYLLASIQY